MSARPVLAPLGSALTTPATPPSRTEDAEIARRAAAGERTAIRTIYDRHVGPMRRHLAFLLGGDGELDDAIQTTFVRAFQNMARFRGDCALSTWLHRIAINEARQLVRARIRRERREDVAGRQTPAESSTPERRLAARDEAMRLLHGLPDREREAFVLCQYEELTLEEAAAVVGVPSTTLSSRLQRARQKLAQSLRERNPASPRGAS